MSDQHGLTLEDIENLEAVGELDLVSFDAPEFLTDKRAIAVYLTDVLAAGDVTLFLSSLRTIARSKGINEIAEATGLSREALLKALTEESVPRFDIVLHVLKALDIGLIAFPSSDVPRVAHESPFACSTESATSSETVDATNLVAAENKISTNEAVREAISVLLKNGYALRA